MEIVNGWGWLVSNRGGAGWLEHEFGFVRNKQPRRNSTTTKGGSLTKANLKNLGSPDRPLRPSSSSHSSRWRSERCNLQSLMNASCEPSMHSSDGEDAKGEEEEEEGGRETSGTFESLCLFLKRS